MANFYGQFIGFGAGDGGAVGFTFGGTQYGFACGNNKPGGVRDHSINKFSFTSDDNAADWGDLSGTPRYTKTGHSDIANSYSYNAGGYGPPINEINRFSMTSSGTSNDVGNLTQITSAAASVNNATHAFTVGHEYNAGGGGDGTVVSNYAFAATVDAATWGVLSQQQYGGGGATNGTGTYGYIQGGYTTTYTNNILKVNLTSEGTSTNPVDVTVARLATAGNSSSTHGYNSAGWTGSASDVTDRFNMSTDSGSEDVGNLTTSIHQRAGASSTTYAYVAGGSGNVTVIDKHSFESGGDASAPQSLNEGLTGPAGSQY
jgi:hypothetical protein